MAFASAFTGVLSTPARNTTDDDLDGGADLSLPSLAESFHSDYEREKDRHHDEGARGNRAGKGEDWNFREPPGTAKKESRVRKHFSAPRPSSPTLDSISYQNTPAHAPSSLTDLPTPQPANHWLAAPSSKTNPALARNQSASSTSSFPATADDEEGSGYSDDLFDQSPMGSPEAPGSKFLQPGLGSRRASGRVNAQNRAQGGLGSQNSLTLKEQEKALDLKERENFDLKLKVHFLTERLKQQSPETLDNIHQENLQLKVAYARLKIECKKNKKYVLELVDALEELKRENDELRSSGAGGRGRGNEAELNEIIRQESEKRREVEENARKEKERNDEIEKSRLEGEANARKEIDQLEHTVSTLRNENETLAERVEQVQTAHEDAEEELRKTHDELYRKEEELEKEKSKPRAPDGLDEEQYEKIKDRIVELEEIIQSLEDQLATQQTSLTALEEEREDLYDEREELNRKLEDLENSHRDRSLTRAGDFDEERNEFRDRLAAATLELERKEVELQQKEKALQEAYAELDGSDQQWADEVKETKAQNDELKDVLQDREKENEELRDALQDHRAEVAELQEKLAEVEGLNTEITDKLEEHFATYEAEKTEREAELLANNEEIRALGDRVHELEDELDVKAAKESELETELNTLDAALEETQGVKEEVVNSLKEALAQTKADLVEVAELYDAAQADLELKKKQVSELSDLAADLETKRKSDETTKKRLLAERDELSSQVKKAQESGVREAAGFRRELSDKEAHWNRSLQDKEDSVRRLTNELDQIRDRLVLREKDLNTLQENARKLGHTHDTDRFSMELEVERLKEDLRRAEDSLDRVKTDLNKKEIALGLREDALSDMHAKSRELENKLSSELQARLNISDKLDVVQKTCRTAENEAAGLRERVEDLEHRLTDDHRTLSASKSQSDSQKRENSQLLMIVYQNVTKILGAEDRGGPPTNFAVFRDTLLARLRTLVQIQSHFEKKMKQCENAFTDKLQSIKKQLDHKWKQLDHFESSVRKVELVKTQWRNRYAQKQGELESLQSRYSELNAQLTASNGQSRSVSTIDAKSSQTRITTLERRLGNATNQLAIYEEKMASARSKMSVAESKWDVRVREYESRLKLAEEKVKSEKQGGKERAAQLESQVRNLEKQIEIAKRRNERIKDALPPVARVSLEGTNSPRVGSPRVL